MNDVAMLQNKSVVKFKFADVKIINYSCSQNNHKL